MATLAKVAAALPAVDVLDVTFDGRDTPNAGDQGVQLPWNLQWLDTTFGCGMNGDVLVPLSRCTGGLIHFSLHARPSSQVQIPSQLFDNCKVTATSVS